ARGPPPPPPRQRPLRGQHRGPAPGAGALPVAVRGAAGGPRSGQVHHRGGTMTEGYGSGYGDEGGQQPSGGGAVPERLARQDRDGAHEADLTDETARESRESSGAFEPAAPTADPPAGGGRAGAA